MAVFSQSAAPCASIQAYLFVLVAAWLGSGCAAAMAEPVIDAAAYSSEDALNPRQADGRQVFRSFGDHHPSCFVLVPLASSEAAAGSDKPTTEEVACPPGAVGLLQACPAGRLFPDASAANACVCIPIAGEAERVECER